MTPKNYTQMEELYKKYAADGFRIAAFPCNQFGGQEPWPEAEIKVWVQKEFGVTFDMYAKIEVNGDGAHPIFKWLKDKQHGTLGINFIKWNFGKFLVNRQGAAVNRYAPTTAPFEIEDEIVKLLGVSKK